MFRPLRLTLPLLLAALPATAATLGELQLRSALGERLDALVNVRAAAEETIDSNCFSLDSRSDDGSAVLYRARLLFAANKNGGGSLRILSENSQNEPLLSIGLRMKCEDGGEAKRDYQVLLDPAPSRNHLPVATVAARQSAPAAPAGSGKPTAKPVLGGYWNVQAGESLDDIARTFIPRGSEARHLFIADLRQLNAALRAGKHEPLPNGLTLKLPKQLPSPHAPLAQAEAQPARAHEPNNATKKRQPTEKTGASSAAADQGNDYGRFQLRLSGPTLDLENRPQLTDLEKLQLKERLLLLDADDQTAKLLQLQNQVSQMEKHLGWLQLQLQGRAPAAPAAAPTETPHPASQAQPKESASGSTDSLWLIVLLAAGTLLALIFALLYWNRRPNTAAEPISHTWLDDVMPEESPAATAAEHVAEHGQALAATRNENDWLHDEMAVAEPSSVSEEAALLVEHGLVEQAIALLRGEVHLQPRQLVLWMQLFELYQRERLADSFHHLAIAFKQHFVSEALWAQVAKLGLSIAPNDPLYRGAEMELMDEGPHPESARQLRSQDLDVEFHRAMQVDPNRAQTPPVEEKPPLDFELDHIELSLPAEADADDAALAVFAIDDSSEAMDQGAFDIKQLEPILDIDLSLPHPLAEEMAQLQLNLPEVEALHLQPSLVEQLPVALDALPVEAVPSKTPASTATAASAESYQENNGDLIEQAEQYVARGDIESAALILEELLLTGDWDQKNRAAGILNQLNHWADDR